MTPFLVATLLALLVAGTLAVLYREDRRRFRLALSATIAVVAVVVAYLVLHAHRAGNSEVEVTFSGLRLEAVAGSYRVSGRVDNPAGELAVSSLDATLKVEHCPAGASCSSVLSATQRLRLSVPPGTSRAFVLTFPVPPGTPGYGADVRWSLSPGAPTTHRAVSR